MSEIIKIDKQDVTIERIEPDECGDCRAVATHAVILDIREAGFKTQIGDVLCERCAVRRAKQIRGAL